jgi:hypothetical protein
MNPIGSVKANTMADGAKWRKRCGRSERGFIVVIPFLKEAA